MDLPNLKELKAMLKLCRSQGVTKITLAELIIEFGDMPMVAKNGEMIAAEESGDAYPSDQEIADWSIPQGMSEDPLADRMKGQQ